MKPNTLDVRVDLLSMQGIFFRRLQHQLDITKILQVGCESVTEIQVKEAHEFGSFAPANGAQLSHEEAQGEARDWLLRGFLRDSMEGTGLFLDECLSVCTLMHLSRKEKASAEEINRALYESPRAHHKLYFPQKLEKLKREFNVTSRFEAHVLSLNKARTCVVHRLAEVSSFDVDETGKLKLLFQHAKLVARGEESGFEVQVQPNMVFEEDAMIEMHFVDRERSFAIGERIRLQPFELYDTIITLWRFGLTMALSIEAYGKSLGLDFKRELSA